MYGPQLAQPQYFPEYYSRKIFRCIEISVPTPDNKTSKTPGLKAGTELAQVSVPSLSAPSLIKTFYAPELPFTFISGESGSSG